MNSEKQWARIDNGEIRRWSDTWANKIELRILELVLSALVFQGPPFRSRSVVDSSMAQSQSIFKVFSFKVIDMPSYWFVNSRIDFKG